MQRECFRQKSILPCTVGALNYHLSFFSDDGNCVGDGRLSYREMGG